MGDDACCVRSRAAAIYRVAIHGELLASLGAERFSVIETHC